MARQRVQCLYELPQGPQPGASGYKGFFHHFLDIDTGRHLSTLQLGHQKQRYGFKPSCNQTLHVEDSPTSWWVSPCYIGIDQGPVVLMIENNHSGLIWDVIRRCSYIVAGLRRAGFTGRKRPTLCGQAQIGVRIRYGSMGCLGRMARWEVLVMGGVTIGR